MVINMDKKRRLLFLIIFSFVIDFISKRVAIYFLSEKESSVLIPRFFSFTLAKNTGGAFSILSDNVPIIIILSLFIIYILFSALNKDGYNNFELVCYSLIIGGAFGNLFDSSLTAKIKEQENYHTEQEKSALALDAILNDRQKELEAQ